MSTSIYENYFSLTPQKPAVKKKIDELCMDLNILYSRLWDYGPNMSI